MRTRSRLTRALVAATITALTALGLASIASATTTTVPTPTGYFTGNINSCSGTNDKSVEGNLGLAGPWAGASSGSGLPSSLSDGTMTVDFDQVGQVNGQLVFHWTSNLPIDLAIVKQANGGAYWSYNPAQTSGTIGSFTSDGSTADVLSHVLFCYKPRLVVTKTAATAKQTRYDWTVVKSADPASHQLTVGDPAQSSTYTLDVTKSAGVDYGWTVSGVIKVTNATALDTLVTLSDAMTGGISGTITTPACTGSFLLSHGSSVECAYSASLPDGSTRTNTATADAANASVADGTGTAEVNFANATVTKINDMVNLTDTYNDQVWQISSSSDDKQYSREFSCGESQIYPNTARIVGDDPATPGIETNYVLSQDGATVDVTCGEAPLPLLVEKSAAGSFTRTHTWTVTKSVDKSGLTLASAASGSVQWTIGLSEAVVDSSFEVNGTIKVSNANSFAVEGVDVTDSMSGATIDCDPAEGNQSTDLTIPAKSGDVNGFVLCSYSVAVAGAEAGDEGENTATATVNGEQEQDVAGDSDTASWSFGEPTEVDAVVDVRDTNGMVFEDVSDPAELFPASYAQQFTCGADQGRHTNTVRVVRDNTDSVLSTASADTTVTCSEPPVTPPVTPPATPPVVTPPVVTPPGPLLPPTVKPKPKPKPKPRVKPALCTIITVTQKSVAAGKTSKVTVKLTAGGKAVAGANVRFKGAGINKVVKANRAGIATVSLTPKQSGIITVTVVGKKACSAQRLGVVGTFEPPVTG